MAKATRHAITLWTWQGQNHSLTEGRVDPRLSDWWEIPSIRQAYLRLFRLVRTCQLIWCWTDIGDVRADGYRDKRVWELNVPVDRVLCYVDDVIWGAIRKEQVALPKVDRDAIHQQALQRNPADMGQAYRECEAEYRASLLVGDPWSRLMREQPCEGRSALLKHPIPEAWVVRREEYPFAQVLA